MTLSRSCHFSSTLRAVAQFFLMLEHHWLVACAFVKVVVSTWTIFGLPELRLHGQCWSLQITSLLNTAVTCVVASSQSWVLGMQVEDFYFSSAAGRARIVLGNRRWGENGYVASGRQQGRPVQRTASKVKLPLLCSQQQKSLRFSVIMTGDC